MVCIMNCLENSTPKSASLKYYYNNKEKYVEYRENNKEKVAKYKRDWYERNKDRILSEKAWLSDDIKQKKKEYDKRRYEVKKEEMRAYERERRKLPHRKAAHAEETRRRRMHLKQATPSWITQEDKQLIKDIYTLSAVYNLHSGLKWHVDHILPLRGELVCGLHVPDNLQIIPATANIKKHNKHFELDRKVYK